MRGKVRGEADQNMMVKLGRRIKAHRALHGISQKELAEKCGISSQTLSNLELGKNDFRISTVLIVEEVLKCRLLYVPEENIF